MIFCRRDYDAKSERQKSVKKFYKQQHTNQTVEFIRFLKLIIHVVEYICFDLLIL